MPGEPQYDFGGFVRPDDDAFRPVGIFTVKIGPEIVLSDGVVSELEVTPGIRASGMGMLAIRGLHRHTCAGYRVAARIDHGPRKSTQCDSCRPSGSYRERGQHYQSKPWNFHCPGQSIVTENRFYPSKDNFFGDAGDLFSKGNLF